MRRDESMRRDEMRPVKIGMQWSEGVGDYVKNTVCGFQCSRRVFEK